MMSIRARRHLFASAALGFCVVSQPLFAAPPETTLSLSDRIKQIRSSASATDNMQPKSLLTQNPVYAKLLKGIAFIGAENSEGESWQGTGWVLDLEQRLIVTNHHVIEGVEDCTVFFPLFTDGELVTSLDRSLVSSRAIKGRVVDSDQSCDLALIQLESMPKECVALSLADKSASPGQRVHSIAGNTVGSQSLWTYSTGYVRQILVGELANGGSCMMLESDMATNLGNSGGPVCDDEERVVAVVEGHSTEARLVSLYIDLQALTAYLEDSLRCVDPKSVEDIRFAAKRHLADARFNTAMSLASAAVKLDSKSAENFALRGDCWLALEDVESAEGDFIDALAIDSRCAAAHAGRGDVAASNDEYDDAIKHYSNAIRNDSGNAVYLVGRGHLRLENCDYEDALKDFSAAIKKDSTSLEAIRGKAFAQIELDEFNAGGEALAKIIDQFSDDAETLSMFGRALNGLDNRAQANHFFSKAIELDETHTWAHSELGENQILLQDFPDAVHHLGIAVDEWEDDARTYYLYGVALFGNSDFDTASTYLEKALELDPDDEEISTGVAELQEAIEDAE